MKKFEVKISWEMAASIFVDADTEREASLRAMSGTRPLDGEFVPRSMRVDSVEPLPEWEAKETVPLRLQIVK